MFVVSLCMVYRIAVLHITQHITQPSADMYDADSDDSDDEEVVTVGQIAHERKLVRTCLRATAP